MPSLSFIHLFSDIPRNTKITFTVVLQEVKDRFSIQIPPSLPFRFIHIPKRRDPSTFKRLTLIAESIDTIKLAWYALHQFTPHVFVDTTGCAFTFLVAKLARCKIVAYVHYPTVSTVSSNCILYFIFDHYNA